MEHVAIKNDPFPVCGWVDNLRGQCWGDTTLMSILAEYGCIEYANMPWGGGCNFAPWVTPKAAGKPSYNGLLVGSVQMLPPRLPLDVYSCKHQEGPGSLAYQRQVLTPAWPQIGHARVGPIPKPFWLLE